MRNTFLAHFANVNVFWFWLPILVAHLLTWTYQVQQDRWLLVDSEEYVWAATNMWEQGILYSHSLELPIQPWHYTKRPPLYPTFLIFTGASEGHFLLLGLAQMILSLFNLLLAIRIMRELGLPQRSIFVSFLFILLYPAQVIYANLVMSEILLQTLLTVMTLAFLKAQRLKQPSYLWIACSAFCLALLTKPVMYLYVIPFAGIMLGFALFWRKFPPVVLGILPVILLLAYISWNESRTGYAHVSSIQQINLLQYNAFTMLNQTIGPEKADSIVTAIRAESLAQPSFAAAQTYVQNQSIALILADLPTYFILEIKGIFNMLIDPGRFDLYNFFGLQSPSDGPGLLKAFREEGYAGIWQYLLSQPLAWLLIMLGIAAANVLKLGCLILFPFQRAYPLAQRMIILLPIGYLAGVTGPIGTSRFAVPLFPLLLVTTTAILWPIIHQRSLKGIIPLHKNQ